MLFSQRRNQVILVFICHWHRHRDICTFAEDMINPYQWQKDIDQVYPKYWLSYAEAFATKLCWSTQWSWSLCQAFWLLDKFADKQYLIRKEQQNGDALQTHVLVNITKIHEVPSKLQMWGVQYAYTGSFFFILQLSWRFQMAPGLSHKVSLVDVKLFHDFVLCNHNFICQTQLGALVFCGIYSYLNVYPGIPGVVYTLNYFPTSRFAFFIFLDIMSTGILHTCAFHFSFLKPVWKIETSFLIVQKQVYVYKVEVQKYLIIFFSVTQTADMSLTFYKGPGRLSTCETVQLKKFSYTCDGFVCFASAVMPTNESHALKLKFYCLEASHRKVSVGYKHLHLKLDLAKSKNMLKVIRLLPIALGSHIKASVQNFSMKAPTEHRCLYGGISFYPRDNSSDSTLVCTLKKTHFSKVRNVYSDSHNLLIVAYAYENYAELSATAEISLSSCDVIKINLCLMRNSPIHEKMLKKLITGEGLSLQTLIHESISAYVQKLPQNKCSIVQFFWKVINKCHKIPFFGYVKKQFPAILNFQFYSFLQSVELRAFQLYFIVESGGEEAKYEYKLEGILSGDPQNFHKRHWLSSLQLQLGHSMVYNLSTDFRVVISHNNVKKQSDGRAWWRPKLFSAARNPLFTPALALTPWEMSDWYFTVKLSERTLQSSLALKLQFTDKESWLDLRVSSTSGQRNYSNEMTHFMSTRLGKVERGLNPALKLVLKNTANCTDLKFQIRISTEVG